MTSVVLMFFALLGLSSAFQCVPLVVASHTLIKGLKDEIEPANHHIHNVTSASNMLKKLVTECSSDEYIIIDQPGLTNYDLTVSKNDNWQFVRKYLELSSSVVSMPWVREPVDINFIEKYIIKNCDAETINVVHEDENEVSSYIDIRKKIIKIQLEELPRESPDRDNEIRKHDALIRNIIRKLPSPHYTVILTSSTTTNIHPRPMNNLINEPDSYIPFNDIVSHPSRDQEIERNNHIRDIPPVWIPERNTIDRYLRRRKADEVHLLNPDLLKKHQTLVTTIALMALSVVVLSMKSFVTRGGPKNYNLMSASNIKKQN